MIPVWITCIAMLCTQNAFALSWWDLTPLEVRARINERIDSIDAPVPDVWAVEEHVIENGSRSTAVRMYRPNQTQDLPIILFIHGGAWVAGNLDTHDNLARYFCSQAQAIVVSVGYTNAPEGKFPLQLIQSQDALSWIIQHAQEFAADHSRIAIAGDSAGGNMAAALCLMIRDQQGPKIAMQVLINPAPDLSCNGTLIPQNDSLETRRWQAFHYLFDPREASHPYVSPLMADNVMGLPEAVILLAEKDDLRPAGQKYADKLIAAGIPTEVYCQKGINHLAGDGAKASLLARESLDIAVAALQRKLRK